MKKKKIVWLLGSLAVIIVIGLCIADPVFADVGNSFSGGSGSSSGGSSSGGGDMIFDGIFFFSDSPIEMIIFIIILIAIMYYTKKHPENGGGSSNYSNPGIKSNEGIDEEAVIEGITEEDEEFSADEFRNYASEVWLTLQEAWEQKDWHKVRPFESNTLFNVHNRQLQEYIDHKKTNYLNMQNVRSVKIASYQSDDHIETVHVKLDASLLDYVMDDETNKIIEGSKTDYVYRSYDLEFIRKKGVQTVHQEGTAVTNCPNCGAPTTVTSSGQCEYCKSVITNGDFGWVLNQYKPWQ